LTNPLHPGKMRPEDGKQVLYVLSLGGAVWKLAIS